MPSIFYLKKVTLIVSIAVLASYFASAEQKGTSPDVALTQVTSTKTVASAHLVTTTDDVMTLFTEFDRDQDGLLSRVEVAASNNKTLIKHFTAIDKNNDEAISAGEFAHYFSAVNTDKSKAER